MTKCNFSFFYRKKKFNEESIASTRLSRVLGLLDITAIGENFKSTL
jgi:hypothetical protein